MARPRIAIGPDADDGSGKVNLVVYMELEGTEVDPATAVVS